MRRSTDRIIVSHVGALPRPLGLPGLFPVPKDVPEVSVATATRDIVAQQAGSGVDVVNDGEFGKLGFLHYASQRLAGIGLRPPAEGEDFGEAAARRELNNFPGYYGARGGVFPFKVPVLECTGPISFTGEAAIEADIGNLKAAMQAGAVEDGFLTAISPWTVALMAKNFHYASEEEYLGALADALHDEYKAITDAGIILQIDDPGLAHAWQKYPEWSLADCRRHCEAAIDVINYALRDSPQELVRLHSCWGSFHGPHVTDLELGNFIDLLYRVNAECYSLEGANARHEHEWTVLRDLPLPEGKSIMPGVVSHATDIVEHPELVAQRLQRWADVAGRENIIAGTDCGMIRVHPELCWVKMEAMAEGARIASEALWQ